MEYEEISDPIPIGTASGVRACVNDTAETALEHVYQRPAFRFAHVHGAERKAAQRLITDLHYSANPGGSGFTHAIHIDDSLVAACLIGPTLSKGSERSLIAPDFPCRLVKRLVARDDCPVPESQLLRMAMRDVANKLGSAYLAISYADPVAQDVRTGRSLYGALYLASGFFFCGFTSQPRYAVVDDLGVLKSTRQGRVTLTKKTLPKAGDEWNGRTVLKDWAMIQIPPARVWIVPVTPWYVNGEPTSRAWRKHQYLEFWRNLNIKRLVHAQRWINRRHWQRLLRMATVEEVEPPRQEREHALLARARWQGALMTRTAGPIWPPIVEQGQLFAWSDVAGETTAGRLYWPRGEASEHS